jgi:hypothetical protein
MNIDTLVKNFYSTEDEQEDLINEVMKLLLIERPTGPRKYTVEMIPAPPVNELGWGALDTPEGKKRAVPVDKAARTQLSQYLKSVGARGDLRDKIRSLNRFFSGQAFPGPSGGPGNQLKKTIAYLVTFKTLTQIITNFNAASAGFTFESFLAVLLDATSGRQVPAAGASTIADILVYKDARPISLKLYQHGKLKVGGSYRQLIEDLTGDIPLMEYVGVTKDIDEGEGKLYFYSFQFTLQNVAAILALGKKSNGDNLAVPAIYANIKELKRMQSSGELEAHLDIPDKGYVDLAPLLDAFYEKVMSDKRLAMLSDEAIQAIDNGLKAMIAQGKEENKFVGVSNWKRIAGEFPKKGEHGDERTTAKAILGDAHAAATTAMTAAVNKNTARSQAFERLAYLEPKESIAALNALAAAGEDDLLREALKNTQGMNKKMTHTQFEMSQSQLDSLPGTFGADNKAIFPYGTYEIGILEIGMDKVQDMLDRSVNSFNEVIFQIFDDLTVLSKSLNGYVAGGLEDTNLAATAKAKATDIAEGTEKATGDDSAQLDFGFEE